MPLLPIALLVVALAAVAWFAWRDVAEYAAFKQLTDTRARQARYRRWLLNAFVLFVGGSLAILAALGDLGCVLHPPRAFLPIMRSAQGAIHGQDIGPAFLGGIVGGAVIATVAATVVATLAASRRREAPKTRTLGDVEPLMPRNGSETVWTGLLSINAGVSEELFFRLTLPLLIVLVTGNAALAFVAAAIVFGLAHVYQGWVGVAATGVLGLLFTGLYLWSGGLAVPIALHVFIDLMALVARPTLARLALRR